MWVFWGLDSAFWSLLRVDGLSGFDRIADEAEELVRDASLSTGMLAAASQRTEFRSTGTDAPDGGHSPILRVACRYFCRFGRASKAPVLKPAAQERTAFTASVPARRKSSFRLLLGIEPSKGKRRNPFHDRGRAAKGQSCGFFGEFYIALSRVARIRLSQGCNRTREGSAWPIGCLAMKIQE